MEELPEIFIITGEIGQGKTTFVKNLVNDLKNENLQIAGFLALGKDTSGTREGFNLHNLLTDETIAICTTTFQENYLQIGKYFFDPTAFSKGNNWLINTLQEKPDLVVIDEIGPMELQGKGWAPALNWLTKESKAFQIWIIRKGLVDLILKKWKIDSYLLFDIASENPQSVKKKMIGIMNEKNSKPAEFRNDDGKF